ncbi:MAG: transglutaminase domain-containing protein [Leptospiraceae bacterium]|nr:transglutaminase domain-containing protein [Leptospiraceae bacterium]MCP5497473.1 transglutaminase domain-containing protein [Leptospiraceae bacterium]
MKKFYFLVWYLFIVHGIFADQKVDEVWYDLIMMGKSIGYVHETVFNTKNGFATETQQKLTLRRGDTILSMEEISSVIENRLGQVVSFIREEKQGEMVRKTEGKTEGTYFNLTTTEGEIVTERKVKWEKRAIGPQKTKELLKNKIQNKEKEFEFLMFSVDYPNLVLPTKVTIDNTTNIELYGKKYAGNIISIEYINAGSLKSEMVVNQDGLLLKSYTKIGPITIETLLSDKSLQNRKLEQVTEIMESSFIKVGKIKNARNLKKAKWEMKFIDSLPTKIVSSSVQSVQKIGNGIFHISIDLDNSKIEQISSQELTLYLADSSYISTSDKEIQKLASSVHEKKDKSIIAEQLRQVVYNYIQKKNLSMGFASASQTVRSKEGDCTEHSVLLAALLRTSGIPSRVAVGVVYADQFLNQGNLMGYHMWTQGYINDRWVDLDASIDPKIPFDATHILFATAALESESGIEIQSEIFTYMNSIKLKKIE